MSDDATLTYCPQCGNVIQDWMHGKCYTCKRIDGEHSTVDGKILKPLPVTRYQESFDLTEDDWQDHGEALLDGFNRLLTDIYGRKMRISTILTKHDFHKDQVARWRNNRVWIIRYLERLERNLLDFLRAEQPQCDARILSHMYMDNWSIEQIAEMHQMSQNEVKQMLARLQMYLRCSKGRKDLEAIMVQSVYDVNG
ncbi:MAG: hypothetical protein RBT75_10795 [Anaerolineae bacterium]|jgi:hypothetical protein|nr:hypothetical protein [Anaerolineae bacterium]